MRIRPVNSRDIPQIARLYFETVRHVNRKDYDPAHIAAWAPRVYPDGFWQRRFKNRSVYVVEQDGAILGFAELTRNGHIDCFYVHHQWQGRGVGSRLINCIETQALRRRLRRLDAEVSITAMPFFKRKGFRVIRRLNKIYRNRNFRQFYMVKRYH
jgi:putative acetyltransferase